MNEIVQGMIAGYGPGFPSLEELFALRADTKTVETLSSPTSLLGRYGKSVEFMNDITSGKAIGLKRFYVIKQYLIALSDFLAQQSIPDEEKIIGKLSLEDKDFIMETIGVSLDEIFQAEKIEAFTEHDTAAAGDFIKLKIANKMPHLARYVEAVGFAETSEDTMSIVFGLIANELILGHLSNRLADFCFFLFDYCHLQEAINGGPLILPELTHLQAAEPTTHRIKSVIRISAIQGLLEDLLFTDFSAKMGGAIGNLTCHYAAYPELDWHDFAKKYIEDYKLTYEPWTDQCVSYAIEAGKFLIVANILTQVIKLTEDFIRMASCPAQLFVKQKKKGAKGSFIMPNKSNAWAMEGAVVMLKKSRNALTFLAEELPNYPNAGNMGRSFLFRELGTDVMPIFIALDRITREMKSYAPCQEKINSFLQEYPGMSGSALQTVLKRMRIPGDAYRAIQDIAVNPDGAYANQAQFADGLAKKTIELGLNEAQAVELQKLLDPGFLVMPAHQKAILDSKTLSEELRCLQIVAKSYIK
ncbi:MAG: lyase family protein [Patescibacteria group bacterium]